MQKGKKIAIILVIGAAVAALSYYFLIFKPAKAAKDAAAAAGGTNPAPSTGSGTSAPAPTPANTSLVGKSLYAKQDGVRVVYLNGNTYKIAKKGEWIGLAYDLVQLSGQPFYKVSGNNYVAAGLVYAK